MASRASILLVVSSLAWAAFWAGLLVEAFAGAEVAQAVVLALFAVGLLSQVEMLVRWRRSRAAPRA